MGDEATPSPPKPRPKWWRAKCLEFGLVLIVVSVLLKVVLVTPSTHPENVVWYLNPQALVSIAGTLLLVAAVVLSVVISARGE